MVELIVSVPLQGTYLLYEREKMRKEFIKKFPSPYRGLIFFTQMEAELSKVCGVSVPLQGTYLLYAA